jgi:integrase
MEVPMHPEDRTPEGEGRRLVKTKTAGIYRRGNRYVVRYRDPRGRERKRFAKTMAEARDLKATLTADVKRGEYRALSRVTFVEYARMWITTYAGRTSRGLRDATRRDYARELGLDPDSGELLEPEKGAVKFFGRMRLAEIEPRDLKEYAKEVASRKVGKRNVSANTVRLALAPVKAMLATAVEEGLIRSNPAAGLRIAQVNGNGSATDELEEEKVKALTEEELARLLAAVAEEWGLLVTLLAQTGLRVSEALPLRWGDVDFGRRRLAIRRSLSRGQIGLPKTRHGRRDVPLTKGMARALWNARKAPGVDGREEAVIFPAAGGGYLERTKVFRAVKTAAKTAGVPWAGLHTLRHTAATILFRRGWNAVQVQKFLGHHSPAFTLATYVHLLPDDLPEPTFFDDFARPPWVEDGGAEVSEDVSARAAATPPG